MKIGIIGLGYVGGAVKNWFERQKNCELFLYDKHKEIGSVEEVNKAEIIFVAVPTPFHEDGRGYDDSAVRESLANISDGKTVVIKSTILPGSTEKFQKAYPNKIILFSPEFLSAKTAEADFLNPTTQIVGYASEAGKEKAAGVLKILPKAPYAKIIKSGEAEMVKYFKNTFFAVKVIFANQMYDLCQALKIDYDMVKECASRDPRVGSHHLEIFHDGYRGYGGACLPKDVKALIQLAEGFGLTPELLKTAEALNEELKNLTGRQIDLQ